MSCASEPSQPWVDCACRAHKGHDNSMGATCWLSEALFAMVYGDPIVFPSDSAVGRICLFESGLVR